MSALKDRLAQAIAESPGVTKASLARAAGVKPPSVSDWFSGKTKTIEGANLLAVAAHLGVRPEWLATGKGAKHVGRGEQPPTMVVHPVASMPDDVRPDGETEHEIETLEFELSAGSGKIVPTVIETHSPIVYRDSWFRRMRMKPASVKRVRVDGDSMESTLFDGDYGIIHLDDKRIVDGRVYALIFGADRHGRIKRLYRTAGGVRVVSDNPDKERFPDELVEGELFDEMAIIGRVVDKSGRGGL